MSSYRVVAAPISGDGTWRLRQTPYGPAALSRLRSLGVGSRHDGAGVRAVLGARPVAIAMVAAFAAASCAGPSIVPLDTRPTDSTQAENLGYSVASGAHCGNFESLDPAGTHGTWHYTCSIGDTSYDMVVFGSDPARQAGLAALGDTGAPFVAKNYYAVSVAPSGPTKAATAATAAPSLLAPFE
jgi:hypothetical protein